MKLIKKSTSILIIFLLVISLFTAFPVNAGTGPWSGSGTESDPWLIRNITDLLRIHDYICDGNETEGKFFQMTNNINLSHYFKAGFQSWTPIGKNCNNIMNGTFNGNGYTISGLYTDGSESECGLFSLTGTQCVIKNLNVQGTVIGANNIGGISGKSGGTFENCTFSGEVRGSNNNVGGIVGNTYDFNTGSFVNCSVTGNVSGYKNIGGIAGFNRASVTECSFSGSVTGDQNVGGISGDMAGYRTFLISSCTVNGTIIARTIGGGIIGITGIEVESCSFTGEINGNSGLGGITGVTSAYITNCENHANVIGVNSIGGITGTASNLVRNCKNYGTVHSASGYAGGIIGVIYYNPQSQTGGCVENCYNYVDVTADGGYAGGIAAYAGTGYIRNCHNSGNIHSGEYVGGIAGYSKVAVEECTNTGNVSGDSSVGDMVGSYEYHSTELTLKPNGAPGDTIVSEITTYPAMIPECPYTYDNFVFYGWNTKSDGTGSYYLPNDEVSEWESITLYAIWMKCQNMDNPSGAGQIDNPWLLKDSVYGIYTGFYTVDENTTMSKRLIVTGNVDLTVPSGMTLNCGTGYGINVSEGNTLTFRGPGNLNAVADLLRGAAGIGGSSQENGGSFILYSGNVWASGGDYGSGIGGGDEGKGGHVTINGGTVHAFGSEGASGIGGGDYGDGGTLIVNGGNVYATGSTRSTTEQAASGIGAGRPKARNFWGYENLDAGTLSVYDGTVTAVSGTTPSELIAQAVGVSYGNEESFDNADYTSRIRLFRNDFEVTGGDSMETAVSAPLDDKVSACLRRYVHIERCSGHVLSGRQCQKCGACLGHEGDLGNRFRPYTINSTEDWNNLSEFLESGFDTTNIYFEQTADITVSKMLGTQTTPFCGIYSGVDHKLIPLISSNEEFSAPFRYIRGARIFNLHIEGRVQGGDFCAGLAGQAQGTCNIGYIRISSDTVTSDDHCAGFIGDVGTSNITMDHCVFEGSISRGTNAGTFIGWGDNGSVIMTDCTDVSSSDYPIGLGNSSVDLTRTCYINPGKTTETERVWSDRGSQAYSVTAGSDVTLDFGVGLYTPLLGITYHDPGFEYNGVFYACENDEVPLTTGYTGTTDEGYIFNGFSVNAGTLSDNVLTVPGENVKVSADIVSCESIGAKLLGFSVSLEGDIGVNLHMELDDSLKQSDSAFLQFSVPVRTGSVTKKVYVKDAKTKILDGKTCHVFKCNVAPSEIRSAIKFQMIDGDRHGTLYSYSVGQYAETLLSRTGDNTDYLEAAPLVRAMLRYGDYAENYFSRGSLEADEAIMGVNEINAPAMDLDSLPEGVTFENSTLSLQSTTTLSLYLSSEKTLDFSCGGYTVENQQTGSSQVARIRDIPAKKLSDSFTLKVTCNQRVGTITYGVLNYCYDVVNGGTDDENLINVVKALYLYAEAADDYFPD